MKRILNLNEFGNKISAVIGIFLLLIPSFLYLGSRLVRPGEAGLRILQFLLKISIAAGLLLLVGFVLLIVLEQIQDAAIDRAYQKKRKRKIKLPDGSYECQFCGKQKLRENDRQCPVCGNELDPFALPSNSASSD